MALPSPDICELMRAHFILLGLPGWKEEERDRLLKLLAEHGLSWSALPEVLLATANLGTTPPDLLTRHHFAWGDMPQVFADAAGPQSPKKLKPFRRLIQSFGAFGQDNSHAAAIARKELDRFLTQHKLTWSELAAILAASAILPAPDPRVSSPHPYDDPQFTPAGLVEGLVKKYATMGEHERVIYTLWIILTHVYERFTIAPRIALTSDEENCGKTILVEIARLLGRRPNADSVSTGPAIIDHIDKGPGIVRADELDLWDAKDLQWLRLIWNLGHWHLAQRALMVKGKRKLVKLHAPVIASGIGDVLKRTQMSRAYGIKMYRYTAETKPERDFFAGEGIEDFDHVYSFLHRWAPTAKLELMPKMPEGVMTRFADNAYGMIAIADACGTEWGERARKAVVYFMTKDAGERPWITFIRHGLVIFDTLEVERISSTRFNKELKRLDLPDAKWTRYCGASGLERPHPLEMHEQAWLAGKAGTHPNRRRWEGERFRGYDREQFEEALRKHGTAADNAEAAQRHLRLVAGPSSPSAE